MTTIRFKKDNNLFYIQNFRVHWGIPSDVVFDVEFLNEEKTSVLLHSSPKYTGMNALFIHKDTIMPTKIEEPVKKERKSKKKRENK
jgi:hypothetical protein